MIGARIRSVVLIGVVGIIYGWWSPVRGQEVGGVQSELLVAFQHTPGSTTINPEIPIEELKLKLLPLTKSQLESEASAWQLLLQGKVNEISDAEIAIKRQNRQAKEAKEAKKAVEKAQLAVAEARAAQAKATPDTPEYEEATQKVEAAQVALENAREAVREAVEAKENIEQDSEVQKAVESALEADSETGENTDLSEEAVDRSDAEDASRKIEAAAEALEQEIEAATEALEQEVETVAGEVAVPADSEKGPEEPEEKNGKLSEISQSLSDSAASTSQVKKQVVVKVTELLEQRVAIADRFKLVLKELEKKGGETEQYQTYINAVSGVEIDVTDTESLEVRIVRWFKSEEGGWRWGINIAKFVAIVLASIVLSKIASAIVKRTLYQIGGTSELLRQFITMLIERGGIVVGVLLALTALEVSLGPILALLGGASFVLAFALQSNLSNFASGLMIMIYKPFDIGDEIRVNGLWGFVDSITLANTKIQGFSRQNVMYNIPNSSIWGSVIENMTSGDIRAGVITIRSSLKNKIRKVEEILLDIAKSHPKVLADPPPATMPFRYEEYYVSIDFAFRVRTPDFWGVWVDIMYEIEERFEREGIIIALPQQEISIQSVSDLHKIGIQSGNQKSDREPGSIGIEIPDPQVTSLVRGSKK